MIVSLFVVVAIKLIGREHNGDDKKTSFRSMFKYQKWVSDWRWFHVAEKKEKMERKPKNKIKGQHPYGRKKDDEK